MTERLARPKQSFDISNEIGYFYRRGAGTRETRQDARAGRAGEAWASKGATRSRFWRRARSRCRANSARPCSGCARPTACPCRNSPSSRASPNRSSARSSATRPIRRSPRSGVWRRRSTFRSIACCRPPTTSRSSKNPRAATRRSWSRTTANAGSPSSAGSRRSNGCNGTSFPPIPAACSNPRRISAAPSKASRSATANSRSRSAGVDDRAKSRRDAALSLRPAACHPQCFG